jgi:hypothetical protein
MPRVVQEGMTSRLTVDGPMPVFLHAFFQLVTRAPPDGAAPHPD